ncbi:magnesium transporter CorA family protein [Candidatus Kaiserbacteria bacterium]|nr:magnesium transporter CorA family protein [Candidatus Kaiserbacteria bacterium]
MIVRYLQDNTAWIDVLEPTAEEIRELMEEYAIDPGLVTDLAVPTRRADVVSVPGAVKITLDFPVVKLSQREFPQEMKFIVTKNALITVRYADIAALHQFAKEFEVVATLQKTRKRLHGGHLFLAVMNALYGALSQKLDYIEARLVDIEEEIVSGREKEMVLDLSQMSQRLIMFRQTLVGHEYVLEQAKTHFGALFGASFAASLDTFDRAFAHLTQYLSTLAATGIELRETNNTLLTTKQNEIMKTLTILASVTFPLALLSSIFGMNTTLPLAGTRGDFWIVIGIMVVAATVLFAFFRHKHWM